MTEYQGMPPNEFVPAPQILKNTRMIITGYEANPDVLEEAVPDPLEPHPNNRVQMNMYEVTDGRKTSHLDSFSLTYLTVEIADHNSTGILASSGDRFPIPGRWWIGYWNSSPKMQTFTRELGGIPAQTGATSWEWDGDHLTSTLSIDGDAAIQLEADAPNPDGENYNRQERVTGHLNYFARRQLPSMQGNQAKVDELVQFPIANVFESYKAEVTDIEFSFPDDHRAQKFAPTESLQVDEVLYGDSTFVYPQGRVIHEWNEE